MSLLSRLAVQAARAYGMLAAGSATNVSADYLVVAGGASGGVIGGGGAGGYRTSTTTLSTLNTYSITVGAGGAGATSQQGNNGSDSSLSGTGLTTITSTGGGGGAGENSTSVNNGKNGGSGGGAATAWTGSSSVIGTPGNGNTPSTSPSQGNNGGAAVSTSATSSNGGGGGGAGAVGGNATGGSTSGSGGAGSASSISGSSVTYAGGGGAGAYIFGGTGTAGTGGSGGGGNGGRNGLTSTAGTANTGGGGGGRGLDSSGNAVGSSSGAGGSGIVIISYTSATPKFVGGTITTSGGKQIHTFTSSGTLSPITPITASYLVVAGGGSGGGENLGGGGGAGGLLTGSTTIYSGATYVVTVGAGGAQVATANGNNGSNSVLSGTGLTTITSTGGGGGGSYSGSAGQNGGSGGGQGGLTGGSTGPGTGISGQGFAGGNGNGSPAYPGGGGGGAGAVGGNATTLLGGNGGVGVSSSISGTATFYAGGGGGSSYGAGGGTAGAGGNGGGGAGGTGSGTSGTPNTGGGGGGADRTTVNSGSGGSGIVIISYAGSQQFNGGLVTTSGGNTIHTFTSSGALTPLTNNLNNSLRFRSSASAYLSRTPTVAGNQQKFTWSGWVKIGYFTIGYLQAADGNSGNRMTSWYMRGLGSTGTLEFEHFDGTTTYNLTTSALFRDPSAWYHITVAVDTTQATSANRTKIYVNGNQQTVTGTYVPQNTSLYVNGTTIQVIGSRKNVSAGYGNYFDGYMTDINFIDGQQLEPYYFGNNDANQVWKPIQYKGTYGTNGFYLTFGNTTSTTTLGYDSSPNGNNWTCNNISLTAGTTYDAMTDVPTNTSATVANYAVMNPLTNLAGLTVSNANLNVSTSNGNWKSVLGTMALPSTDKWYWEVTIVGSVNGQEIIGVANTVDNISASYSGSTANTYGYQSNGSKNNNASGVAYGASYTTNDIIGVAVDTTAGTITYYKNNTSQGTAFTGLSSSYSYIPAGSMENASSNLAFNFGQRPFAYTPPTGYVALNTYNLPTPTILQGNKYMDATLYTGNGTSQTVTNAGAFKPDLVWLKERSSTSSNWWTDSNRGNTKIISSNATDAEVTETQGVTSFNTNGFSLGSNAGFNENTITYVGWQWQAGQGTTSSGTGTGGITSVSYSVSTTAGFSVVIYTGSGSVGTVTHGLGVAPKMIIIKNRGVGTAGNGEWQVYHASLGNTQYLALNTTAAAATATNRWNNTSPTSSVFTVATTGSVNDPSNTYVAYCWAEIAGFSKFGSYTGNGSTDGPFVYLGFRPKFIIIKQSSASGENWVTYDTVRNTYNVTNLLLHPNLTNAESTTTLNPIDILSNGFKLRGSSGLTNTSSATYIYAAFAENPFKNSNAR